MKPVSSATQGWFVGRLPDGWFSGPPEITYDRDEILVIGILPDPEGAGEDAETRAAARLARIESFREETRQQRIRIAAAAEDKFGRKVAWGAECGGERVVFTTLSIPVMTRLRMKERAVLDTLVEANVARSRSEALAWCVQLVREHEGDWIEPSVALALFGRSRVPGRGFAHRRAPVRAERHDRSRDGQGRRPHARRGAAPRAG